MLRPLRVVAVSVGLAGIVGVTGVASCLSPTEITVVVTTDFDCSDLHHVTITVGTLGRALETSPPTSVSTTCTAGNAGTIVVVPSGSKSDLVAIKVVGGFGKTALAEDCTASFDASSEVPSYGAGCIVARRALRYAPHTPLTVPIALRAACSGVPCGETETCVSGACVSATIDTSDCAGAGCDECKLVDGGCAAKSDSGAPSDASADAPRDADSAAPIADSGCLGSKGWPAMTRFDVGGQGSFCIDPYEVTQGQFNAYLNDSNRVFDVPAVCTAEKLGTVPSPQPVSGKDNLPVANITWCDAWSYCKWAGKRLCSAIGHADAGHAADDDLITNEWVYACVNGQLDDSYPYGNVYQRGTCNILDDGGPSGVLASPGAYANCHGIGAGFGQIFDMSGNVAEMDDWATDYVDSPDASASRVHTRGGAFDYNFLQKCQDRFPHAVFQTFADVGFRCCADVSP